MVTLIKMTIVYLVFFVIIGTLEGIRYILTKKSKKN